MSHPPRPAERRAAVRHLCDPETTAVLRRAGEGLVPQARVYDASAGGLGLLLPRPVEPGSLLTVELRTPGLTSPVVLEARVAHATPRPDGSWLVGCALLGGLSEGLLAALAHGVPC